MNLKTIISVLVSLLLTSFLKAQQQGQSSLYFYNQHFYNPAYISINKGLTFITNGRNQWINFNGAPKTANFCLYSSIGNNLAAGLSMQVDKIGATQTSTFMGNFGYEVSFKKKSIYKIKMLESSSSKKDLNHISFGLSFGANYYQTFYDRLKVNDVNEDIYQDGFSYSQTTMNIGFGLMYYNSVRFIGISIPTLIENSLNSNKLTSTEKRHTYIVGGFIKEMSNGITLRPSTVIKYTANAPIAIDINLAVLLKDRLWLGLLFKNNPALGINTVYTINTNFSIGYAYEQQLTSIQRYTSGSHEIMLSYKIPSKKRKNKLVSCPKF